MDGNTNINETECDSPSSPSSISKSKSYQLIKYLASQYPLLCRTYFSEKIMPRLYENLKTYSFISLTAHFIRSDDMQREILVLSAKHFPDSHTGFNIGQILNDG
ncbi:hypothetical protein P5V15_005877 [Pogonomyrmex californicus]